MSIWDELDHFKPSEFDHPDEMNENLLRSLDRVRHRAHVPMVISSDFRPGDSGAHGQGLAVDVKDDHSSDGVTSHWRFKVVLAALMMGFNRIGIYDKHIHLDIWSTGPQEVIWFGTST